MSRLLSLLGRRPRWQVAAAAVLALGLVVAGYWFLADGPGARLISPPGSTVAQFTGTGDAASDSFDVRPGWRMRWSTSGRRLTVSIRGEQNLGTVVDVDEAVTGVTSPPTGGVYHLEVSAEGPWTIAILQGD